MKTYIDRQREVVEMLDYGGELHGLTGVLIPAGRKLPAMWQGYRTDVHRLRGCISTSYFVCEVDHEGLLHIEGESDSAMISGVMYFFWYILNGAPAGEVDMQKVDWHRKVGLAQVMSKSRNGAIRQIVDMIKAAIVDYE